MSWAKYKDAEKHFTLAMIYYSSNNVAEKFQQTIFTKSSYNAKEKGAMSLVVITDRRSN